MTRSLHDLKLERPLAFLGLEATGRDPGTDRVVELAVLKFAPEEDLALFPHFAADRRPVSYRQRLDPGIPIPPDATALNHIADAGVSGRPSFRAIAHQLGRFLEGCDLAGFRLRRFDLPLLCAEFGRAEVAFAPVGRSIVDLLPIFHDREPRDLVAAVGLYCGRVHSGAHGVLADATAAADVLAGMLALYDDLPRSVAGPHELTAGVDIGGRFAREGDRIVLGFGKYWGRRSSTPSST